MKTWYKRPLTKGILLVLANVTAVIMAISLFVGYMCTGNLNGGDLFNVAERSYEESEVMINLMHITTSEILMQQVQQEKFETNGKYNPDKLVDIVEYHEKNTISGENTSGLAYRLEDLKTWGEALKDGNVLEHMEGNIVVCQKPDQTYMYYYISEFESLVRDGKLTLVPSGELSATEVLQDLGNGDFQDGLTIKNEKNETVYTDCWTFNEALDEKVAPDGAANVLEVINSTPKLNGRLVEMYEYLDQITLQIYEEMTQHSFAKDGAWEEGNTNFSYMYVDKSTKKVYTNRAAYADYEKLKESIAAMKAEGRYLVVMPKLVDFESDLDVSAREWRELISNYKMGEDADYLYMAAVDTAFPIQDEFYTDAQRYETYTPFLKQAVYGVIISTIAFLGILIWLTVTAGRNGRDDKLHFLAFDRIKTEIWATLAIAAGILPTWLAISFVGGIGFATMSSEYGGANIQGTEAITAVFSPQIMIVVACITIIAVTSFYFGYLSLVRRMKARSLWKNSIFRVLCRFFRDLWLHRGLIWKTVVLLIAFLLIHWIAIGSYNMEGFWIVVVPAEVAAGYYLLKNVIAKDRIQKGIGEIATGNVDYVIPIKGLLRENLVMAEAINNIGDGLQQAVEESMKSERLKTDLITNVSHDIKTPLTSIINYVDLLKRENFTDPKVQGYLNILEAKAQRLKSLTEDVVEASKVSSGNISLECMDLNLVELVNQTNGEFEGKFVAKSLEVVLNISEDPAIIHVDGKRMWRILENIYGNATKYAMPGTRVYIGLQLQKEKVIFSLKNISEQPLNISADELTERFIRGDISRSTEGSGLGLSIAKSLTKLQGGELVLYLDGDLFKVTVEFPRVYPRS